MASASNLGQYTTHDDEPRECADGWHIDSEMGCFGCESGIDNIDAHCTACNIERGFEASSSSSKTMKCCYECVSSR